MKEMHEKDKEKGHTNVILKRSSSPIDEKDKSPVLEKAKSFHEGMLEKLSNSS